MNKKSTYRFQPTYSRAVSLLLLAVFIFIGLSNQKNGLTIRSAKITIEKQKQNPEDLLLFEEDELDERAEDANDNHFELFPAVLTDLFHFNVQLIQFNWGSVNKNHYQAFYPTEIYLNNRNLRI